METGIHSDFFSIDKGRFEWAGNHVTGVTEDGLMDIVWGEEAVATFWVDAAILVEYYCLEPFYCYVKDGRNRTQNEKIAQEWRDKGHKVKYIDNEYTARFYVDRYHNNGKYYWWILRDFGGKKVNDIELIRKKLVRLNAGIFR